MRFLLGIFILAKDFHAPASYRQSSVSSGTAQSHFQSLKDFKACYSGEDTSDHCLPILFCWGLVEYLQRYGDYTVPAGEKDDLASYCEWCQDQYRYGGFIADYGFRAKTGAERKRFLNYQSAMDAHQDEFLIALYTEIYKKSLDVHFLPIAPTSSQVHETIPRAGSSGSDRSRGSLIVSAHSPPRNSDSASSSHPQGSVGPGAFKAEIHLVFEPRKPATPQTISAPTSSQASPLKKKSPPNLNSPRASPSGPRRFCASPSGSDGSSAGSRIGSDGSSAGSIGSDGSLAGSRIGSDGSLAGSRSGPRRSFTGLNLPYWRQRSASPYEPVDNFYGSSRHSLASSIVSAHSPPRNSDSASSSHPQGSVGLGPFKGQIDLEFRPRNPQPANPQPSASPLKKVLQKKKNLKKSPPNLNSPRASPSGSDRSRGSLSGSGR